MIYGWISRYGDFYECDYGGHSECREGIEREIGVNPETSGWIKITKHYIIYAFSNYHCKPTEPQMETLYKLAKEYRFMGLYNEFIDKFYKYMKNL
jgi:thiol-disulfide isomerase/thioredoxin